MHCLFKIVIIFVDLAFYNAYSSLMSLLRLAGLRDSDLLDIMYLPYIRREVIYKNLGIVQIPAFKLLVRSKSFGNLFRCAWQSRLLLDATAGHIPIMQNHQLLIFKYFVNFINYSAETFIFHFACESVCDLQVKSADGRQVDSS